MQQCCSQRLVIAVNTFIDVLQGPFRNGTCDFRILPGIVSVGVLLFHLFCCVPPIFSNKGGDYVIPLVAAIFGFCSVICAYARPCKSSLANVSLTYHLMTVSAMNAIATLWINGLFNSTLLLLLLTITISLPHFLLLMWIFYELETRVLHVHRRAIACFSLLMDRKRFSKSISLLPDRLVNSGNYRRVV